MYFRFVEKSLIIIPFTLKGYRLEDGERIRFRCLFKTPSGDLPYECLIEEDNKGKEGKDGYYTVTLDTAAKKIFPGRYGYTIELILASKTAITLLKKPEAVIDIVLPKTEGE